MAQYECEFSHTRKEYLTEEYLGEALSVLFPNAEIIHNSKIKSLGFRPDYYIPSENIVVEFNGFGHYTDNKVVVGDYHKRKIAENQGIKTISIPYYIQLNSRMIYHYFKKISNDYNDYPLGFIDKKSLLPGKFSSLGLNRFIREYKSFRDTEKGEKIVVPILISLLEKHMKGKKTFYECFPFITEESMKLDLECGLYGYVEEDTIKYLVNSIESNLKMIKEKDFYC